MCGRFIAKTDQNWQNFFTLKKPPPQFEAYNISPSQPAPVVRRVADGNDCELLRWGLIPYTLAAAPFMAEIDNTRRREPAILAPADHETWLAGNSDEARATLRPAATGMLSAHPVSTRVNSPRHQGPELIAAQE